MAVTELGSAEEIMRKRAIALEVLEKTKEEINQYEELLDEMNPDWRKDCE
jgi:altronate dehydratase